MSSDFKRLVVPIFSFGIKGEARLAPGTMIRGLYEARDYPPSGPSVRCSEFKSSEDGETWVDRPCYVRPQLEGEPPPPEAEPRRSTRRGAGATTKPDYQNRNRQVVLRATDNRGNDHGQYVYVLRCEREGCGTEYGANGSDIFQRKCPACQGGRPGLNIE